MRCVGSVRSGLHFICHVGAHKTGSTAIQSALRSNLAQLREIGIDAIDPRHPLVRSTGIMTAAQCLATHGSAPGGAERFRQLFAELGRGPYERVVISHEGLLGAQLSGESQSILDGGSLYPFAGEMLEMLRRATEDPIRVVLYIRSQDGYLTSVHRQLEALGRVSDWADWLPRVDLDRLSWWPVVEAAVSFFGREHVMVKGFRMAEIGPEQHVAEFMGDVLGLREPLRLGSWLIANTNPSLSDAGMLINRAVRDLPLEKDDFRKFHVLLKRKFSILDQPSSDPMDGETHQWLRERYDAENAELLAEYGPSVRGSRDLG